MNWTVLLHDDFDVEFAALNESLQDELLEWQENSMT